MKADRSETFYTDFVERVRAEYKKTQQAAAWNPEVVQNGVFGADMLVDIANDGPCTIIVDTPEGLAEMHAEQERARLAAAAIALSDVDVAAWMALPAAPKVSGKPNAEQLVQLRESKAAQQEFIGSLFEQECVEGGRLHGWGVKRVTSELKQAAGARRQATSPPEPEAETGGST
jgi:hypothetical protein